MNRIELLLITTSILPCVFVFTGILVLQDQIKTNDYIRLAFIMMIFIIWQVSAFISFLAKNKDGYFDKTTKIVIWFNYNLTIFVNLAIITNEMVINNHGLFLTLMIISLIINPILLIYYIKIFRQRV